MADERDIADDLSALPKGTRDFVLSPKVAEANRKIAKTFALKPQEQEELMNNEYKIFFKRISFAEFQNKIKSLAEAGKYPVAAMQKMVTEELLLPINDYFAGEPARLLSKSAPASPKIAQALVSRLKEEPSVSKLKAGSWKLEAESVDPRAAKIADAVIAEIGLGDKKLESKLREVIVARVTGAKDDLETKAMLKRSVNTGGVGLEDSLADTLLGLISAKGGSVFGGKEKMEATPRPTFSTEKVADGQAKVVLTVRPPQLARPTPLPTDEASGGQAKKEIKPLAGFAQSSKSLPAKPALKLTVDWLHTDVPKEKSPQPIAPKETPPVKAAPTVSASKPVTPAAMPVKSSAPMVSDDAAEIALIKSKISEMPRTALNDEQMVKAVLSAVKINFESEVQKNRFQNAIKNRVRDIRDQFETRELLLRSENLGGVGLLPAAADAAIPIIEKIIGEQHQRLLNVKKEESQLITVQTKAAEQAKIKAREAAALTLQNERYKQLINKKIKGGDVTDERTLGFLKPKAVPTVEVPEIESTPKPVSGPSRVGERTQVAAGTPGVRPKIDDIKFAPSLTGPIEELKNFSLKDWQSLGSKKGVISQKLAVLRNESYTKYQNGLVAFKVSPLFNLAQELLIESMGKNMPLAGVIEMRKKENKPYLSEGEIGDIMNIE